MRIWKNTTILDYYNQEYNFTDIKEKAEIALLGSKPINLSDFGSLVAIFRAGIGEDNIPKDLISGKNILIRFPSKKTINIIYDETANYTCNLILRMLYNNIFTIEPWHRKIRLQLSNKTLLVIGVGNIGTRVVDKMKNFMNVTTYDVLQNEEKELKQLIADADSVTLHIPKSKENQSFMDSKKLSWMKTGATLVNTARGSLVDENALFNELQTGRLKAAFDVFWQEPYDGKLMKFHLNGFYVSPHVSSICKEFLIGCKNDLDKLINDLN